MGITKAEQCSESSSTDPNGPSLSKAGDLARPSSSNIPAGPTDWTRSSDSAGPPGEAGQTPKADCSDRLPVRLARLRVCARVDNALEPIDLALDLYRDPMNCAVAGEEIRWNGTFSEVDLRARTWL